MTEKNEFKLIFLGSSGVGKTNILLRLQGKDFIARSMATNNPSYASKLFELEGHLFNTVLWDTSGAEKYMQLTKIFCKNANGGFIVYDIANKNSFDDIDKWIKLFKESNNMDVPIIIIGNKSDLYYQEEVSEDQSRLKAKEYGADIIYTSALTDDRYSDNIQTAYKMLMEKVTKIWMEENKCDKDEKILKKVGKVVEESQDNNNKTIKELKDDLFDYKNEYDKLQKNYDKLINDNYKLNNELYQTKNIISDFENKVTESFYEINNLKNIILRKDDEIFNLKIKLKIFDKLKDDNDKLNIELNKAKNIISDFEDKTKKNFNEINNLKNNIRQKDTEIFNLMLKIRNIESFNKTSFNNNDILYVHFISSDQNIDCPIKCLRNDTFAEVEEKLYQKYNEYRETNNKFVLKEKIIMRFKKIIENNIIDGVKIELIKLE